jgi:hypothetical protein
MCSFSQRKSCVKKTSSKCNDCENDLRADEVRQISQCIVDYVQDEDWSDIKRKVEQIPTPPSVTFRMQVACCCSAVTRLYDASGWAVL